MESHSIRARCALASVLLSLLPSCSGFQSGRDASGGGGGETLTDSEGSSGGASGESKSSGGTTSGGTKQRDKGSGGASGGGTSSGGTTSTGKGGTEAISPNGTGGSSVGSGGASGGGRSSGGNSGTGTVASGGNSGTGTVASGGSAGLGGNGAAGGSAAAKGRFELAWEDAFDTFDSSRWELMTHSFDGNVAQFTAENAKVKNGILELALTAAPSGGAKPYLGVEMRSIETLTYGKIEASARLAAGSGVVSSLVLLYTPWPPDDWNELDIEFLGQNTDRVQFNHMINIPPADPISGHKQYPKLVTLGFNPSTEFHTYTIEWDPAEARFLVDGKLLHTATNEMQRMVLPQNIIMTIWASNSVSWAGPIDATTAPTRAEYDWIKMYRWVKG